ncbi:MAG: decarboxylase [Methylococcaceae bacterium]|nr:decarboxylase [Methylococcaceae bacterium]
MHLSWEILNNLAESYGESFYLLDLAKFQQNYRDFLDAFQSVYANSQIAYSYKTNYTPRLCRLVQDMGGYAEVVSGMEYGLALKIGVPATRIIFNGPYKQATDFEQALLDGAIINLDAAYEVIWLKALAARFPQQTFPIGIRCNFTIATQQRSRFGFDIESADFQHILQSLRDIPNCRVIGLHCHFLAPERSAEAYSVIAKRMVALAITEFSEQPLEFIDLGGGFFSRMGLDLQQQFPHPIPSFVEYGQALAGIFAAAFPGQQGPELILEPGLALVADSMQFVAKTIDIKQVGERNIALVAGSHYDIKPTLSPRNLPMSVVSNADGQGATQPVDIVGTTCMEGDCLYSGYVGELKANDYVIFDNVGAYTNVLRPPFITPAPPILSLAASGTCEVVRRRETAADLFASYIF